MTIDWPAIINLLKPLGATTLSDTLLWINWARKDGKFSAWEFGILGERLLVYGGIALGMTLFGVPESVAITAAGIGPMAEYMLAPAVPTQ